MNEWVCGWLREGKRLRECGFCCFVLFLFCLGVSGPMGG